jgi:hypothetical protein
MTPTGKAQITRVVATGAGPPVVPPQPNFAPVFASAPHGLAPETSRATKAR